MRSKKHWQKAFNFLGTSLLIVSMLANNFVLFVQSAKAATPDPIVSLNMLSPTSISIAVKATQSIAVEAVTQAGVHIAQPAGLSWASDSLSVATVDNSGIVTGVIDGTANVTASLSTTSGTLTAKCAVKVGTGATPVLTAIGVLPASPSVEAGKTQQFTAYPQDQFGNAFSATVNWSTSNKTIGTIDSKTGLFSALAPGTVDVTATSGSVTGTETVTVAAPAPGTFNITATQPANTLYGGVYPQGTTSVNAGASKTYSISANSGYAVSDVQVDGTSVGALTSYTFNNVNASHSIAATFIPQSQQQLTITASAVGGGTISLNGTSTVSYASSPSFTITPNSGYHLVNIVANGQTFPPTSPFTWTNLTTNLTVTANFAANNATNNIVATAGSGGTISPSGTQSINFGGNQTYNFFPSTGYVIDDVQVDGVSKGAVNSYTFSNVQDPHTINVNFIQSTFNIVASSGANGTITPAGTNPAAAKSNVSYAITPASGYRVVDVVVDGVSKGAITTYLFSNVRAAHTISATFAQSYYHLTATAGANGTISPSGAKSILYTNTQPQTYTITPSTNYHIADVQVDGTSVGAVSSYQFQNLSADHTIAATFAINTATITASAGAGGNISQNGTVTVNFGTNQTYNITPSTNYHIIDVQVDGISMGAQTSYTFNNIQGNHTISATFGQNSAYIQITPANTTVVTGSKTKFTAVSYDFTSNPFSPQPAFVWSTSGTNPFVGTIDPLSGTFTANSAGTITVNVTDGNLLSATITVTVVDPVLSSIVITPVNQSISVGSTQQFMATGIDQNGSVMSIQPNFSWSSDTLSVGTIDSKGFFTSTGIGTSAISVTSGSVTSSTTITVGNPKTIPVYRFRSSIDGRYLYTADNTEKNYIQTKLSSSWVYEGAVFNAYASSFPGVTTPVYRFRNLTNGRYLFTASEVEKNSILANYKSTWVLESASFNVAVSQSGSTNSVARFRNLVDGRYLLTANPVEIAYIQKNLASTWILESSAFNVPL